MERVQPSAAVTAPVVALALAGAAAVCFGVGDAVGFVSDAAEDVFIVTWLLAWVLLVWAVIVGGGYAVVLSSRWLSRRSVAISEAVLAAASLGFITAVMATHALWGSGSGVGT